MRLAIYYPRTLTEKLRDGSLFWHAALYSTLLAAIDHHFWGRIYWSLLQLEIWVFLRKYNNILAQGTDVVRDSIGGVASGRCPR